MRQHLKKAVGEKLKEKVEDKKWQGRLLWTRWEDGQLSKRGCFALACVASVSVVRGIFCFLAARKVGRAQQSESLTETLATQASFAWLNGCVCVPTHALAGVMELYEQLLRRAQCCLKMLFLKC